MTRIIVLKKVSFEFSPKKSQILASPRTGGSVGEHLAVTREVVSSTPTGPTLRVLK